MRSRLLRENAGYISEHVCKYTDILTLNLYTQSFLMRRYYFNNSETGYFKKERPTPPSALTAMGGNHHTHLN